MRIRRHKLGQREETTEELSERVLARLRREYSLVSSEVWVDDVHRVDFVGFRPARNSPFPSSIERGEFVFVEVKSCMNDFKSGHGLTFRGDANWLVCPPDLAQTLYETRQLPKDAAVFCPDARGRLQKKFDLGIGSGSSRIASVSELLFRMVNHSVYSYRTSRGVFSNSYCPWCSPYRAKLLNDIDDVCGDMDLIEGIELALEVNDPQGVHLSLSHDNGILNAEKRNLITGTRYMNVEGMLPYEMRVSDFIFAGGGRVYYKVTPDFRDGELVARGVRIQAYSLADKGKSIDFDVYCYNVQPGYRIDYATGEATKVN